jgi:hypothetical protein
VHYGADALFLRPAELASSTSPDIEWIKHAFNSAPLDRRASRASATTWQTEGAATHADPKAACTCTVPRLSHPIRCGGLYPLARRPPPWNTFESAH